MNVAKTMSSATSTTTVSMPPSRHRARGSAPICAPDAALASPATAAAPSANASAWPIQSSGSARRWKNEAKTASAWASSQPSRSTTGIASSRPRPAAAATARRSPPIVATAAPRSGVAMNGIPATRCRDTRMT
ncbi:MAG: hypothetical protein E6J41_07690 [Chloroflexi bacterium]|nr:MAG: hypothetical protein E6J41_07690 [Chloroflexota bacterium]